MLMNKREDLHSETNESKKPIFIEFTLIIINFFLNLMQYNTT